MFHLLCYTWYIPHFPNFVLFLLNELRRVNLYWMSEASFCFYNNILVETKEKLFPLLLSKFLRILLLLKIFIFIPLALWYYLSLVIKKCQQFFFSCHFLLDEKTITLTTSCSGRAVFCFLLFYQSLGIGFNLSRVMNMFVRGVGFNKFIWGYKARMCYSWNIFCHNK